MRAFKKNQILEYEKYEAKKKMLKNILSAALLTWKGALKLYVYWKDLSRMEELLWVQNWSKSCDFSMSNKITSIWTNSEFEFYLEQEPPKQWKVHKVAIQMSISEVGHNILVTNIEKGFLLPAVNTPSTRIDYIRSFSMILLHILLQEHLDVVYDENTSRNTKSYWEFVYKDLEDFKKLLRKI